MKDWEEIAEQIDELIADGAFGDALRAAGKAEREFGERAIFHLLRGDAHWAIGDLRLGMEAYEKALALDPESFECASACALALFELLQFDHAGQLASRALQARPSDGAERAPLLDLLSLLAERRGNYGEADRLAVEAAKADPTSFLLPCRMTEADFLAVADEAVEALPAEFLRALRQNLAMVVEPVPPIEILTVEDPPLSPCLLGLYTGIPLPDREESRSPSNLPDVIHLFQRNIEREASTREGVAEQIVITVYHEIGHYFGMDEADLEDLDLD